MLKDLKLFLELLHPYRHRVRLALVIGGIAGLCTGAGITIGAEKLFGIVLNGSRGMPTGSVIAIASIFPILFLVIGICTFLSAYHLNHAGLSVIRDLRAEMFSHIQRLPLAFFQTKKTGDLIARLTADTQAMQYALTITGRDLAIAPLTFLGAVGMLAYKGWEHDGVIYIYCSIALLPLVIFPVRKLTQKLGQKAKAQQEELATVTNDLSQNIGAAKEVRAFNLQYRENDRFASRLSELFRSQMKVVKYTFSLSPFVEIISSVGLASAFVIGYYKGVSGEVFIAIFAALYFSYAPIKRISYLAGELKKGAESLKRIREILAESIGIDEPDDPADVGDPGGEIVFSEVSFAYGDTPALSGISTKIDPGCVCALVGPSGAGKSTFANLVPRFYDVSAGSISLDGIDIRNINTSQLREQIAIVSQDPVLFDDSIMENIRLGRQSATDDEVAQAAKQAFAHEFIENQESGYRTIVGERGARLSGGQKQRIAIARAFLRDAPILILDEATSALDSESEGKVQHALERLVAGKTVLMIAHRFSSIKIASKIIVFEDGHIIDEGSHAALYDRCLLYKSLYDQQSG
ncbi:MAG TPA: ABC transporter ATP-binding protein [Opitutae bacterium]|nr:ABC transporter [Opitutaceae bacterium]HCR31300.1 ABC transporter ATP-binding protein [Opitutae bacterium]|tara:strand:+ start:1029 stop:2762 length:1734 start_codon:yes stop_codon:yes gene_type:complete